MDTGDAVPEPAVFSKREVDQFYLPAFCAVNFHWTPEQTNEQDWDTVWGILEVMPDVLGQGQGQGKESNEQRRDRKEREYAARVGARRTG